jgi:hypothetical protein
MTAIVGAPFFIYLARGKPIEVMTEEIADEVWGCEGGIVTNPVASSPTGVRVGRKANLTKFLA